jgi:two-component system, chemotaxis family, protein-glutamate methylesterase/glutaminase
MDGHDIVVVGASAGGVEALSQLAAVLPGDLDAAVFVVLHISAESPSALPAILARRGRLPACHARHGDPIEHGRIYVAPPDHHLLVGDGVVHLANGPRENGHRPAVDPLFRSAAAVYGPRVAGVVLSGALDDGTAGLAAIKQSGGATLVQDPRESLAGGMPLNAIEHVRVDQVLGVAEIGAAIVRLASDPLDPVADELAVEADLGELDGDVVRPGDRPGDPSGFSCPDCGGVLWELHEGDLVRFRCRVGHAWSAESLLGQQAETLEAALWVALRSLEERSALSHRLMDAAMSRGYAMSAHRFAEQALDADKAVDRIRDFLLGGTARQWLRISAGGSGEVATGVAGIAEAEQ